MPVQRARVVRGLRTLAGWALFAVAVALPFHAPDGADGPGAAGPGGLVGCSSPASLLGAGAPCEQATDCQSGLVCVPQPSGTRVCSSNLSAIQHTEDGGTGAKDSGTKPVADSGGGPPQDSGAPPGDSGTPPQDSGSPQDTGGGPQDTGAPKDTGSPADTGGGVDSSAGG